MRAKMRRASSIALLITDRPGAVRISAAALRAASVAPDTAVPQSACFKAGASLTPSPVIATKWPRACSALTIAYLCSGKTRAKPSAFSIASAICGGTLLGSMSLGKASAAGMMWVPRPSWRAVSMAMAVSSPVTILIRTPFSRAFSMVALESSRGGSNIGRMPSSDQLRPPSSERATARAREPFAASSSTVCLTRWATSAAGFARSTIACGAPLVTVMVLPVASVTVSSVRLLTGSNGTNFTGLQLLSACWSFSAAITAVSMASRSSIFEARAAARMQSCGSLAANRTGSPRVSWFLVSVPVLSEHRMSTPAISSIAESDGLLLRERQRAQCHRDGKDRRHRRGDRRHQENQHELQDAQRIGDAPIVGNDDVMIDLDRNHDERQGDREGDQEVADLEHCLLRMADRAGAGHELGGAPEESVGAGRDDHARHLALPDDAARIGFVADLLGRGQRLARQRGLVDRCVVATDEAKISG